MLFSHVRVCAHVRARMYVCTPVCTHVRMYAIFKTFAMFLAVFKTFGMFFKTFAMFFKLFCTYVSPVHTYKKS